MQIKFRTDPDNSNQKRLYRTLFTDHFYPNLTALETERLIGHGSKFSLFPSGNLRFLCLLFQSTDFKSQIVHCLDMLRQAVMCQADISPIVLTFEDYQAAPRADFSYQHECINWDALTSWASSRRVDVFEPGLINHPKLGMLAFAFERYR